MIQSKRKALLRLLAIIIDLIIIMLPIQLIMMGVFQVSDKQAELFFCFLFAVYGTLCTEYANQTLGKYFGKLKVVHIDGNRQELLFIGIRELTKAIYFIPYIGWAVGAVSVVLMIFRKDKRSLHDIMGNTKVVCVWEREENDK